MALVFDSISQISGTYATAELTSSTLITFFVPPNTPFDIYYNGVYNNSSSQPDGEYTISNTFAETAIINNSADSSLNFTVIIDGVDSSAVGQSEFSVTMIDENADTGGGATGGSTTVVNNQINTREIKTAIDNAGVNNVAALNEINLTLQGIATSLATIAENSTKLVEEATTIDDTLAAFLELADHPSGKGIRTIQPYGYIGNAILYQLYVKQAQAIAEDEAGDNAKAQSLAKLNETLNEMFQNLDPNRGGFGGE